MPTYRFDEYMAYAEKSLPCANECGNPVRRQKKFTETDNPFNKNADGTRKTVPEIRASLAAKAKAWKAEPETCSKCKNQAA